LKVNDMMLKSILTLFAFAMFAPLSHAAELDLETATILDLQAAYDAGLSSASVVSVYLERIAAYDQRGPALNAVLTLNPQAMDIARALDAERAASGPRSLLHGVPILVKDNYDTYDMATTGGAKALAGTPPPPRDAFTVARLRAAGAIVLAKTNLDEFARGGTGTSSLGGQVKNAYNLEKIPGGSSGGSGQGVAALFGQVGLGTETGSSIRNPSTKANLVGFSPSEGLVSRAGIIPISITYDRAGPMARSVTDAAITMSVMAGTDAADLFSYGGLGQTPSDHYLSALQRDGLKGARIGVLRGFFGASEADRPAVALIDAAIETLESEGAVVIDPLPTGGADLWEMVRNTSYDRAENRPALEFYFSLRGPDFPIKTIPDLLESGGTLGRLKERYEDEQSKPGLTANAEYAAHHASRVALRNYVQELMKTWQLDALVYPHETRPVRTIAEAVPDGGATATPNQNNGNPSPGGGNRISTATGLPTLTVPAGFNSDGVPVGIEFLGKRYDEATVIRLAYAYEQAAPHRKLPRSTPLLGIEKIRY
jgi:Asp-tRNA(Asn)/Glu-tRNA(Gln) amidotransferase A subunit family amidase